MIPSGKAHNDMLLADLSDDAGVDIGAIIDEKGKMLV
jgi:acetolactate synthase-1/2/3 large subunit